ncbi:MAG: hypothetical protein SVK54_07715, partial [candidate division WOR-3 bacterium]|nr:hypothetical protein [candidate division WOR-3 bacterium]
MKSVLIGAGKVFYSIIIFILSILAARFFSVHDYGLFREFYLYLLIGISVSGIPATNAVYYFRGVNIQRMMILFAMSMFTGLSILALIIIFTGKSFIWIIIASLPGSILYILLEAALLSEKFHYRAFSLTLLEAFSFLIPIPIMLNAGPDIDLYFRIFLMLSLTKAVLYMITIIRIVERDNTNGLRHIAVYTLPVYINSIVGMISGKIDKYIVSALFGPSVFAFYSSGAFEVPLVGRFINGVFTSKASDIRTHIRNGTFSAVKNNLSSLIDKLAGFTGLLSIVLIINARFVIETLFTVQYSDAFIYFTVYLFILPIRLMPMGFLMSLKGRTKELMYLGTGDALLTTILAIVLIYLWGPVGGAFAFISVTFIQVLFILYFIRGFFPVRLFLLHYFLSFFFMHIGLMLLNNHSLLIANSSVIVYIVCVMIIILLRKRLWK